MYDCVQIKPVHYVYGKLRYSIADGLPRNPEHKPLFFIELEHVVESSPSGRRAWDVVCLLYDPTTDECRNVEHDFMHDKVISVGSAIWSGDIIKCAKLEAEKWTNEHLG